MLVTQSALTQYVPGKLEQKAPTLLDAMHLHRISALAACCATALLLAACGGSNDGGASSGNGGSTSSAGGASNPAASGGAGSAPSAGGTSTGGTSGSGSSSGGGGAGAGNGAGSGSGSSNGGGASSGGANPAPTQPVGSYSAVWTLSGSNIGLSYSGHAQSTAAKVVLSNAGNNSASAQLVLNIPAGFTTSNLASSCGATFAVDASGALDINGATIPAGSSCTYQFNLIAPYAAQVTTQHPTFSMTAASGNGLATLASQTNPSLEILGSTPGGHSWWNFPSNAEGIAELDAYITPTTDPGPDSNIYWSNQIDALGGYTGIQSTMLTGTEGVGRQFLFSLWGAINYQPGTPASAGIGGGSFCTMSATATDGSAGVQCRYRYEWQANHTYRFRVTPQPSLGAGWFKSNVTDVTGGVEGDSFDIGSIQVDTTLSQFKTAASSIPSNAGISQWTEYFEWNSDRATPYSTPYSSAIMTISAVGVDGKSVPLNNVETDSTPMASTTVSNGTLTETSGIGQSARGLFKLNGSCLTAQNGTSEGNPVGSNNAVLGTCPTLSLVRANGGGAYSGSFWTIAADGTIELPYSYCLNAVDPNGAAGSAVNVRTCNGSSNQQWSLVPGASGQALQSGTTGGLCVVPSATASKNGTYALALGSCSGTAASWTVPGKTFSY